MLRTACLCLVLLITACATRENAPEIDNDALSGNWHLLRLDCAGGRLSNYARRVNADLGARKRDFYYSFSKGRGRMHAVWRPDPAATPDATCDLHIALKVQYLSESTLNLGQAAGSWVNRGGLKSPCPEPVSEQAPRLHSFRLSTGAHGAPWMDLKADDVLVAPLRMENLCDHGEVLLTFEKVI